MSSVLPKSGAAKFAERHAAEIAGGWDSLQAGRQNLEQKRATEVAEAEALALARIKADTERTLANQALALRDAERAAELAAIERRNMDLEAEREARRRMALDRESARALELRRQADLAAAAAALTRKDACEQATAQRLARVQSERAALTARREKHRARLDLAWAVFRGAHPLLVAVVAVLIGAAAGYVWSWTGNQWSGAAVTDDVSLKLETQLTTSVNPR